MVFILSFQKKNRWLTFKKVMKNYPDGTYETCDVGVQTVCTKDIIGLSLRPSEIANDNKMKQLKQSVASNGWKDVSPNDLHLYLTPNGKYTVCTGGNHRSYLASELRIHSIEASVEVVIPKGKISEDTAKAINALRRDYKNMECETNKLNQYLKAQRSQRKEYNHKDEEKLDEMFNQLTQVHIQIKTFLKQEAYHLGYISEDWIHSNA